MDRRNFLSVLPAAVAPSEETTTKTITRMRQYFGDQQALDALDEHNGDIISAWRSCARERQRTRRAAKAEIRRAERTTMRLWQGPVTLGSGLASAFGLSRIVKAEMSGKRLHRTHTNAGIYGPVKIPPNTLCVLLLDARAKGPQYEAEVLFTGQDYRLHLWKMGAGDTREPQVIEIGTAPVVPPVSEPDILRYLDPEYSASLMEESLSDEIPRGAAL